MIHLPAQAAGVPIEEDKSSAVILAYHRIDEDQYPNTSLDFEKFNLHVNQIINGKYSVLPLFDVVSAVQDNTPLPSQSLAITFEGGYRSIMDKAVPLLIKHEIPFTIFFASDHAASENTQYIGWNTLKKLKRYPFVSFGLLPASYVRLAGEAESTMNSEINRAQESFRKAMGEPAPYFSYPFGEYSEALKKVVQVKEFKAAFGLHSGTSYGGADIYALPRFSMTDAYGSIERFTLVANALPFPVRDVEPADPYSSQDKPAIGFSVDAPLSEELSDIACFISGQDKPKIQVLAQSRVELRLSEPLADTRVRINCTLPGPPPLSINAPRKWRWQGMLLINPQSDELPELQE